jgi:hypothetical protein
MAGLKHMAREDINARIKDIDMYQQELRPAGVRGNIATPPKS